MAEGVRNEIGDGLAECASISSNYHGRAPLELYVPQWIGRSDIVNDLIDEGDQVDWRVIQFAAIIEAGQEQQILNEPTHLTSGLTYPAH
jgi:hypothetical protein